MAKDLVIQVKIADTELFEDLMAVLVFLNNKMLYFAEKAGEIEAANEAAAKWREDYPELFEVISQVPESNG